MWTRDRQSRAARHHITIETKLSQFSRRLCATRSSDGREWEGSRRRAQLCRRQSGQCRLLSARPSIASISIRKYQLRAILSISLFVLKIEFWILLWWTDTHPRTRGTCTTNKLNADNQLVSQFSFHFFLIGNTERRLVGRLSGGNLNKWK